MSEELVRIARKIDKSRQASVREYKKALPLVTHLNSPFFEGLRHHELLLQRCDKCGTCQWYPRPTCIECSSSSLSWVKSSGNGIVYSFITVRQVVGNPGWESDTPYTIGLVELIDERIRLEAIIAGCKPEEVHLGMKVEATFEDVTDDVTLYKFKPSQ